MPVKYELVIDGVWRRTVRTGQKIKHPDGRVAIIGENSTAEYLKSDWNLWPRNEIKSSFNSRKQTRTGPVREVNLTTGQVDYTWTVTNKVVGDVDKYCMDQIKAKIAAERSRNFDLGNGTITNLNEIIANEEDLNGSDPSIVKFASGTIRLSVANQNNIMSTFDTRKGDIKTRARAIDVLVEAASTPTQKLAALDGAINLGWPV